MKLAHRNNRHTAYEVYEAKETIFRGMVARAKDIVVENNNLKVEVRPTFLDPFAPRGSITFHLSENSDPRKTTISCAVIPAEAVKTEMYVMACMLGFCSLICLAIWPSIMSLVMILFGWIVMMLIIYWTRVLNRATLDNYLYYILGNNKRVKIIAIGDTVDQQ